MCPSLVLCCPDKANEVNAWDFHIWRCQCPKHHYGVRSLQRLSIGIDCALNSYSSLIYAAHWRQSRVASLGRVRMVCRSLSAAGQACILQPSARDCFLHCIARDLPLLGTRLAELTLPRLIAHHSATSHCYLFKSLHQTHANSFIEHSNSFDWATFCFFWR